MGVRILHFADLHLDRSFGDLAAVSPALAAQRRDDLRRILMDIVDKAHELEVDYLTVGGDLYEHDRVTSDTAALLRQAFESAQPATVLIAPGNHDPYTVDSLYRRNPHGWPSNVRIVREPSITLIEDQDGVYLYAAAQPNPHFRENLICRAHADTPGPNVLLLHGSDQSAIPAGVDAYCPFAPKEIGAAGFDLALLGHYHRGHQKRVGSALMAYSGAPDRLGFGESAKPHALLVEIEDDAVACKEILTDAADYRLERIDVSDAQSRTDIERMICEWADTRQAADALVRLTLVGHVPRHLDFDLRAIWQNAQGSFRFLDLRSAASLDPEVDPDDPTVQGRFLRKMLTHLDAATDEQQRQELQNALRYGLAALEGREIPSP